MAKLPYVSWHPTHHTHRHIFDNRSNHFAVIAQTSVEHPDWGIGGPHFDLLR